MMRMLAVLVLLLAACGEQEQAALPPPAPMTADATGHYCGMTLADHPGPKGQIQVKSRKEPYWFSSARDTIAFSMLAEEPKDVAVIYVTAMDKAADWANPGPETWVEARKAFFVIGSDAKGGMGQREMVPFSSRAAAEAFIAEHGGTVAAFAEVPRDAVLGSDTPAHGEHK